MSQKIFSQIFIKISSIFPNKCTGRLFKKANFLEGTFIQEGCLIKRDVYLQIQSIVDIAFSFGTRQAIEKATDLQYNLFSLDHIHFFIGISFIGERNEWIYDITFVNQNW